MGSRRPLKVIFMGMGAAGIDFTNAFKKQFQNAELTIYEKNAELGGTWLENRYPGCACDIPSVSYQYTWQRKPDWSQYYSGAKEIFEYLKDVAHSNDLTQYVKFQHRIVGAEWLKDAGQWAIQVQRLNDSTIFADHADFFLNDGGHLNAWKWPNTQGLHDFKGPLIHSAAWDESLDLNGKRVLVIGAGSSVVQIVPTILDQLDSLHIVARSPTWITAGFAPKYAGPKGNNFKYSEETIKRFREDPRLYLYQPELIYQQYLTNMEAWLTDNLGVSIADYHTARGLEVYPNH